MPTLKGTVVRETDKALLFNIQEIKYTPSGEFSACSHKYNSWIPFSQITHTIRDPKNVNCDELEISEWIAEKLGVYDELD